MDVDIEHVDIMDALRLFGEIVEKSRDKWDVTFTSGGLFFEAADEIEQLRSEVNGMASAQNGWGKVQRLKEAGDDLVAVMRSGSDCGWDNAIDAWESATRG